MRRKFHSRSLYSEYLDRYLKNGHSLHLEYYIITALPCEGGKEGHTSDSKEGNASDSKERYVTVGMKGHTIACIGRHASDPMDGHRLDCKGDIAQIPCIDIG